MPLNCQRSVKVQYLLSLLFKIFSYKKCTRISGIVLSETFQFHLPHLSDKIRWNVETAKVTHIFTFTISTQTDVSIFFYYLSSALLLLLYSIKIALYFKITNTVTVSVCCSSSMITPTNRLIPYGNLYCSGLSF